MKVIDSKYWLIQSAYHCYRNIVSKQFLKFQSSLVIYNDIVIIGIVPKMSHGVVK